jgi:hypothetical protein
MEGVELGQGVGHRQIALTFEKIVYGRDERRPEWRGGLRGQVSLKNPPASPIGKNNHQIAHIAWIFGFNFFSYLI